MRLLPVPLAFFLLLSACGGGGGNPSGPSRETGGAAPADAIVVPYPPTLGAGGSLKWWYTMTPPQGTTLTVGREVTFGERCENSVDVSLAWREIPIIPPDETAPFNRPPEFWSMGHQESGQYIPGPTGGVSSTARLCNGNNFRLDRHVVGSDQLSLTAIRVDFWIRPVGQLVPLRDLTPPDFTADYPFNWRVQR